METTEKPDGWTIQVERNDDATMAGERKKDVDESSRFDRIIGMHCRSLDSICGTPNKLIDIIISSVHAKVIYQQSKMFMNGDISEIRMSKSCFNQWDTDTIGKMHCSISLD